MKIAALQYQGDGTPAGDRKARDNQTVLVDMLSGAAASGEISTEMRELQRPKFKDEWAPRPPGMGSKAWGSEFGVSIRQTEHVVRKVPAGFETYHVQVVPREAFRLWLEAQGEPPSEHMRAWLASSGVDIENGNHEAPLLTVMKRIHIIDKLARQYPSLEADFNRSEDWIKKCKADGRGEYYLEKIEEGCRKKWGDGDRSVAHIATVRTNRMGR